MKEFRVDDGAAEFKFKDDDAHRVASYVHGVRNLRFYNCQLTSLDIEELSLEIRQSNQVKFKALVDYRIVSSNPIAQDVYLSVYYF